MKIVRSAATSRRESVPRTRETVMFVRESVAFDRSSEDWPAIAEVAAGFGRGVTESVVDVSVIVEMTFVDTFVVVIVVMLVGCTVTREVTVVELGGGNGSVTVKSVGVGGGVDVGTPGGIEVGIGIGTGGDAVGGKPGGDGCGVTDGKGHPPPHPGGKKPFNDIQVNLTLSVCSDLLSVSRSRSFQPVESNWELLIACGVSKEGNVRL